MMMWGDGFELGMVNNHTMWELVSKPLIWAENPRMDMTLQKSYIVITG